MKLTLMKPTIKLYQWQALNKSGEIEKGILRTHSTRAVKKILKSQQKIPIQIKCESKTRRNKPLKSQDAYQLLNRLGKLLAQGLTLDDILSLLLQSTDHPALYDLLTNLQADIQTGLSLSKSLAKYPKLFPLTVCTLIQAGEASGELAHILQQLAEQQLALQHWRKQLIKSMRYPLIIIITAISIIYSLLIFALPQLQSMFADFNSKLPALTEGVIAVSKFSQRYSIYFLLSLACLIILIKFSHQHPLVKKRWHKLYSQSTLYRQFQISQWCFTLEISLRTGIKLTEALNLSANTVANLSIKQQLKALNPQIEKGQPLSRAIADTQLFNLEFISLIMMAEKTNQLPTTLNALFLQMQTELMDKLTSISKLLEPIIMLVLAVLVGTIVIAMYLPIFTMG